MPKFQLGDRVEVNSFTSAIHKQKGVITAIYHPTTPWAAADYEITLDSGARVQFAEKDLLFANTAQPRFIAGDLVVLGGLPNATYNGREAEVYQVSPWIDPVTQSPSFIYIVIFADGTSGGYFKEEHLEFARGRALPKRMNDNCPVCGDEGEWKGLGLVCRKGHGVFAG